MKHTKANASEALFLEFKSIASSNTLIPGFRWDSRSFTSLKNGCLSETAGLH